MKISRAFKPVINFFNKEKPGSAESDDVFAKAKEEKSPAVVTIEITHPRNFGLDVAISSQATGFVVDKVKGLILSNKHVVGEGPCRAKARFQKNEELDLIPIYRDPVHDFGFFKFDPALLTETPKVDIELDPEGATTGRNALIIGNNGGEKLSFVQTTVARVDRPAVPLLDMNTFYITASDTGVGGSSGAPLLSVEGRAIGMMASGNAMANISMYLPLFRVVRAFEYIKRDEAIPRGTLQISFKYSTIDALLKRKAIKDEHVAEVKAAFPDSEGLLVVEKTLPKGPGKLAGVINGDVLLKLNGKVTHNYVQLEDVTDTFIGKEISVTVVRDGEVFELKPTVQDQEQLSVTRMVEVSNGIFHELQFKVAFAVNLPLEGVFVAKSGYMFRTVPFACIIKRIGKMEVKNLDDFIASVQALENGEVVSVRYQPISDPNKVELATITVDKRWYPFELATRADKEGKWHYTDLTQGKPERQDQVQKRLGQTTGEVANYGVLLDNMDPEVAKFCSALVQVKYSIPFPVDGGYSDANRVCAGIVVDDKLGLVIMSKQISTTLIDVQVIFNLSKTIRAKVVFIHPSKPFSILKYDPALLENDLTVKVIAAKFTRQRPVVGEELKFVGVTGEFEPVISNKAVVQSYRDLDWFGGELMGHEMPSPPFEVVNFNSEAYGYGIYIDKDFNSKCFSVGGGRVTVSSDVIDMIEELQEAVGNDRPLPASVRLMPITITFHDLSEARINNLPDEWAVKLQQTMTLYQQKLIVVKRRMVGSDAYAKLKENDVILAIDGKPVTLLREFYDAFNNKNSVKFTLFRDYEELEVDVDTTLFSTLGTTRILHFGGLILQDAHPAVYYLSTPEHLADGGVYVTHQEEGSPAEAAQAAHQDYSSTTVIIGKLVIKVEGQNVRDLQSFYEAIKNLKHKEFVRLVARDITRGEESVHDIRLDLEYWKTRDMFLDEHGDWVCKHVSGAQ